MAVLIQEKFIMSPDGSINMTFVEDHTAEAKASAMQKEKTGGWSKDRSVRQCLRVPPRLFHEMSKLHGSECWKSKSFLKYISLKFPELAV